MNFKKEIKDNILYLRLEGDLIGEDSGLDLVSAANDAIESNVNKGIINISELRYINSAGIGVLITMLTKLRNKNGELILVNPSESVKKLLIITKLNAIFTICMSEEEAVSKLN